MKVRLVDVDGWKKPRDKRFPNLALMKISAWYKSRGHDVAWATGFDADIVYASKIFTFSKEPKELLFFRCPVVKGGTGFDIGKRLPLEIEEMQPDYSLYPAYRSALGFLTRGCIRQCSWCVVPFKEGKIKEVSTIEMIAGSRRNVVLMDNNFLAADPAFIREQLEKIAAKGLRIDFNQGLDSRLITPENAKLLANCLWIDSIRFACDTAAMIEPLKNAVSLIREHWHRDRFSCYLLIGDDLADAEKRVLALANLAVRPIPQVYRDFNTANEPTDEQRKIADWARFKGGKMPLKISLKDYHRKGRYE